MATDKPPFRTCSEICIDADNHQSDFGYLSKLYEEVRANLCKYPIVELEFMAEHLGSYAKALARRDVQEFKNLFKKIFE